jgi:hypothetical protein
MKILILIPKALSTERIQTKPKKLAYSYLQEKIQKSFVDVVAIDSSLKKRADEVLAVILGSVEKSTEIQAIQAAGLLEMTEGLASNAKACKDSLNECTESGNGCITKTV